MSIRTSTEKIGLGSFQTPRQKSDAGVNTETFYTDMESMVTQLGDDHSHFESPVEVAQSKAELSGINQYVGVGITVLPQPDKNQATIISVFHGSPAEHGGLKSHDSILAVDGLPMAKDGKSYLYLARGPVCSATVLTIKSPGQAPRQVMLVRQQIDSPEPIDASLIPPKTVRASVIFSSPLFSMRPFPTDQGCLE